MRALPLLVLFFFFFASACNGLQAAPRSLLPTTESLERGGEAGYGLQAGRGRREEDFPSTTDFLALKTSPSNSTMLKGEVGGEEGGCEATYGFLPCSDNLVGSLFLMLVYGYFLLKAARFLSDGSELLLAVMDPGIIGGLLLPILGALPDSLLILVSGLGGTKEQAQEQVLVGIGLLAGSTVMLVTVLWGTCLFLGRCDLEMSRNRLVAKDKKLTKGWNLTETGVEVDYLTTVSSWIMMATILPYFVVQFPTIFHFKPTGNIPALIAGLMSIGGLIAYCLYQTFSPWIQERRKIMAQQIYHKLLVFNKFSQISTSLGHLHLVKDNGDLEMEVVDKLFAAIDLDKDDHLSMKEIQVLLNVSNLNKKEDTLVVEVTRHFMSEFDVSHDDNVSKEEFIEGLKRWTKTLQPIRNEANSEWEIVKKAEDQYFEFVGDGEGSDLEGGQDDDDEEELPMTRKELIIKSVLMLIAGTILAAVFADPLVGSVNDFSHVTKIPSFFISFILLPFASNSSEAVSSLIFSSRKKKKNMALTYSQIYGGVTMNNTLCLGIFLAVVYFRQLVWDFSSEVLVIFLVTMVVGLMSAFRQVFPAWMGIIAILMYPFSLGLVAILDYVAGWE